MILRQIIPFISIAILISFNALADDADNITKDTSNIKEYVFPELEIMAPKQSTEVKLLPSSISIMEHNIIEDNNINKLSDVSGFAPNFFMPDYGSKLTSPVYIRGIGSRINSPSVGLNVDHVPYFEKAAFDFEMFDIERIEILRGPQGTLYGRNTMGGLINIYTKSPSKYQGTEFAFNTGNYDYYNGIISHYQKINDKISYSANINYLSEGGYHTNEFTGEKVDAGETFGSRVRFVWNIDEKNTLENITNMEISDQGGYPYAVYDKETQTSSPINYDEYSFYNRDLISNALVYKYKGPRYELHSTTAYQYLNDNNSIDQDFSPESLYYVVQTQAQDVFSQEVIVKSNYKEDYNFLCGGYLFYQGFDKNVGVDVYSANMNVNKDYDHSIYGGAIFHESTMNDFLISNFSITTGIRADYEIDQLDYTENRAIGGNNTLISDTLYPSLTSFQILPKLAFKYKFDYYTNAYISLSRGYKTGGYNSTVERPQDLTYNPEYSWNYEIGLKTSFLENMIYADFALFYIDWKNQQIYQTVPSGRGSMLKNAGVSSSKGFEFSMKASLMKDFDVMASFGYTDARFETHIVNDEIDHSGNAIPNVPLYTSSIRMSKLFHLNAGFIEGIKLNANYNLIGKIFWNEENNAYQDNYQLLDGSLSLVTSYVDINLWARNILNENYNAFYFDALGKSFVQQGRPFTFGIQVSAKL